MLVILEVMIVTVTFLDLYAQKYSKCLRDQIMSNIKILGILSHRPILQAFMKCQTLAPRLKSCYHNRTSV